MAGKLLFEDEERDDNAAVEASVATAKAVEETQNQATGRTDRGTQNQTSGGTDRESQSKTGTDSSKRKETQKRQIKQDYAQAKREENSGGSTNLRFSPGGTSSREKATREAIQDTGSKAAKFVEDHAGVILVIAVIVLLIVLIVTCFGTVVSVIGEAGEAFVESSYLASDDDILAANDQYNQLEAELQNEIDSFESDHPGYDEYRYQLDEITHDPYALTSYLTARYGNYRATEVEQIVKALFYTQFKLKTWETQETRTRTVQVTNPITGKKTFKKETYTVKILNVQLTNKGLDAIAVEVCSDKQLLLYNTYLETKGNRSYLFGDTEIGNVASGGVDYEIPAEALQDEAFANMIAEAEKYLGKPYVWGGSSPKTGFDCSGYVSYVINHCGNGWNTSARTANELYKATSRVSASDAAPGDLIFFQNTYDTQGASHVGIYVGNGMMIHCGNPIQYTSVESNYWQSHFLGYGRIAEN